MVPDLLGWQDIRTLEEPKMRDRAILKRLAALVDRMATVVGIDLEEAALAGRLAIDDIAEAVLRCTGCSAPEAWPCWTEAQAGNAAPGYCRNRDMLARLKIAQA